MTLFAILKWILVSAFVGFGILVVYFLIFPKSKNQIDTEKNLTDTPELKRPKTKVALPPTYENIPSTILFETKNNETGKLTVAEVVEKHFKGGTALVIPLIPIPIGEKENVKVRYFYYTQKNGKTRRLPNEGGDLQLINIVDAFYFVENPFSSLGKVNFQLDSSFIDQFSDIADCIFKNKIDLETFLTKEIASVAILKARSTAPDADIVFYEANPDTTKEFSIGFEYSGSVFSELRVQYRAKKGNSFGDFNNSFGDIFIQAWTDLLAQIQKTSLADFQERKFPNPPPVEGLQYRVYSRGQHESHPSLEQVFQALKSLPGMVSGETKVPFAQYYADRQDIRTNKKRFLLPTK